jgi:hypothetical protein
MDTSIHMIRLPKDLMLRYLVYPYHELLFMLQGKASQGILGYDGAHGSLVALFGFISNRKLASFGGVTCPVEYKTVFSTG